MIDLHCHSTVSDGALAPREVVALAAQNGCKLLALTDHDHTGGLNEARQTATQYGIHFVNGVEISVTWRSRTIHIVALDFDEHHLELQNLLARVRQGRIERIHQMAEKLAHKHGITDAFEGAMARATNPEMVSRTHLAEFLLANGYVRNKQQAFTHYLGEGKSAFVKHQWANLPETLAAIQAAGGIAVIAHPMRYDLSATARRNLFTEFAQLGGQATEVHSGNCTLNDRLNYTLLANQYGLLASTGSDFHKPHDYSGSTLGQSPQLPPTSRPVWQHFKQPFDAA
ncbi:MAG: PHP domain-containing protein [Alysiella sp.]|uniref:PHP domain-containing protein n=1 Tax=Alysiella sp. TaxID=1872483 RepID=UPI0026DD10DA|nr:PHP domain-containing protein [Alysiella sp.]MDO4434263.1 PHP domain-containing protein [Alysiella sp.]